MGYGVSPAKTTTPGRSGDPETQGKQYNGYGKWEEIPIVFSIGNFTFGPSEYACEHGNL